MDEVYESEIDNNFVESGPESKQNQFVKDLIPELVPPQK